MIKNFILRKIIITTAILLVLSMVYFFPFSNNTIKPEQEVVYVSENLNMHDIYLIDKDDYVAKTKAMVESDKTEEMARELLEILIIDGKSDHLVPNGFKAVIPAKTKIVSLTFKENIIKVNFSEDFWKIKKTYESKLVEAIVYTLTSIKEVEGVMLFIGNDILSTMPSSNHALPSVLNRSIGINKKYDLNKTSNITKTTVYYVKEYEENEYYVPVTKINNDPREKINIIIEELASTTTHETTLISYLNANTKLMDLNIDNDIISLNFNSAIMSDFKHDKILESVIETINLSLKDNYNVKEVIYLVDSKEISKSILFE